PAQHDPQHLGEGGVVVDDQHATFHKPHRSMSAVARAAATAPGPVPRPRRLPAVTGAMTPRSVTMAVIRDGGVTSKAGFQAPDPAGATCWPARGGNSCAGARS